jgi:hypothetical protein
MQEKNEDDKGERNREKTIEPSEENPQKRHGKEGIGGDRRTGTDERQAHGKG